MSQFAPLQNDTFLRALLRQPTDYTPVWLMRQAGRYLPEYRATRERAGSFLGLAKNPDYATEVTLQPIDRYPLDASILFSDILTVPDAMGLGLYFVDGEGPKFERPLRTEADVMKLRAPDLASLDYVFKAVTQIRTELNGRVVEGGGSKEFHTIKKMAYNRPDLMHHILSTNAAAVAQYLNAQIDAGAQAVMMFDSWGGALADGAYQEFSLEYMQQVIGQLKREKDGVRIPAVVFTKGGGLWLDQIADIGADAVGLDWTVNLGRARALVGHKVALQGNLDPAILFASAEQIRAEVERSLTSYGVPSAGSGHVFNLGHGISQFTPPEAVTAMVDAVHRFSRTQRAS
jgi:uroporphyrinogen decarboxylase